jgi:hypothetical protein
MGRMIATARYIPYTPLCTYTYTYALNIGPFLGTAKNASIYLVLVVVQSTTAMPLVALLA